MFEPFAFRVVLRRVFLVIPTFRELKKLPESDGRTIPSLVVILLFLNILL
jgi:hypothetical protein